jgi:hypothetical protein
MGTGSILHFKNTGTEPSYIQVESTVDSRGTDTVQSYRKDPQTRCYLYVESKIDSKETGTALSRQKIDSEGIYTVLLHVDTLLNMQAYYIFNFQC